MLSPQRFAEENKENIPPSPRNLYHRPTNTKTHHQITKTQSPLGSHWVPRPHPPVLNSTKIPKATGDNSAMAADQVVRAAFLKNKNIDMGDSRLLGVGHYSKVITATHNGRPIAVKIINTSKVSQEYYEKFLPREIECWKKLRHPNIVAVLGHYTVMHYVYLTMELGAKGDLLSFVQKNHGVDEKKGKLFAQQMVFALTYMHNMEIAHRDLKLENVIVFSENLVKLADFGFAKEIGQRGLSHTFCGSKSYAAPEILLMHPHNPLKADVWSLGVLLFILLTDRMPFREDSINAKIVKAQQKRQYSYPSGSSLSEECRLAIDTMMTFIWFDRPTIHEVSAMPWFSMKENIYY